MKKEIFSVELPFDDEIKKQILVDGQRDEKVIIYKYFVNNINKLVEFLEKAKSWYNLDEEDLRIIQRSIEIIESKKDPVGTVSIILSTEIYGASISRHALEDMETLADAFQYELENTRFLFLEYSRVFLREKMKNVEEVVENSSSLQSIKGWVVKFMSNGKLKKYNNNVYEEIIDFVETQLRSFEWRSTKNDEMKVTLFYVKNRFVLELDSNEGKKTYELIAVDNENNRPIKIDI